MDIMEQGKENVAQRREQQPFQSKSQQRQITLDMHILAAIHITTPPQDRPFQVNFIEEEQSKYYSATGEICSRLTRWDPFWEVTCVVGVSVTNKVEMPKQSIFAQRAAQLKGDTLLLPASNVRWGTKTSQEKPQGR
jgi:hypothetical protein